MTVLFVCCCVYVQLGCMDGYMECLLQWTKLVVVLVVLYCLFLAGDSALLEDVQKRSYVLQWKHGKPENIEPGTFF